MRGSLPDGLLKAAIAIIVSATANSLVFDSKRYLHTTPTGRWAVEMFKDADGKAHRSYKDPKYWQPYYRIVRHW
jgi:hypothetical protein